VAGFLLLERACAKPKSDDTAAVMPVTIGLNLTSEKRPTLRESNTEREEFNDRTRRFVTARLWRDPREIRAVPRRPEHVSRPILG
jgi:hypothetical protein